MAVELKSTVLFFNSYHIHIGICIEGTSMHLNCLHDKWKSSFIIWEEKQKCIQELSTLTHILAHTTGHKTPQSKHSTKHETSTNSSLLTIKLHTVHHTTEDLSQWMAFTREERNHFKEHLLWSSSRVLAESSGGRKQPPKKHWFHDFFFFFFTERSCSVLDQWLLRTVPQGKEESRRFFPFFSMERFWVSS